MYLLQDMLGEDVVDGVLRRLLQEHAFRGPPYPTVASLVDGLRAVTPPDKAYLIDDLFEAIVLYENRADAPRRGAARTATTPSRSAPAPARCAPASWARKARCR